MTNELEAVAGADQLADFETEYVQVPSMPVKWSIQKFKVAQLIALSGKTKKAIAKEVGVPLPMINKWMENGEFSEYVNNLVMEGATLLKAKKLQILTKALDARIEEAEVEGYGSITRKDTLDIITEIRKETGEEKSADSGYMGLLEKLVLQSSTNNQSRMVTIGD